MGYCYFLYWMMGLLLLFVLDDGVTVTFCSG